MHPGIPGLLRTTLLIVSALFAIANTRQNIPVFLMTFRKDSGESRSILARKIPGNALGLLTLPVLFGTPHFGISRRLVARGAGRRESGRELH